MSHPYQSSGGERGQVDRQQHQQRQQLKIHKGAAGWQQLQSAAAAAAEGSTSATVGVRKPQIPTNSTTTFSNSSSLHHQHPLQLPPAASIPPTLPRPAHLPSSSSSSSSSASSSSSSSSTVVRGGSKGGNESAAAPARSGSHVEHEPAFFKMQRPTTSSQQQQQQQQGLVAGRGELPTERLEHTQQQAGGPHHQQSADLEKPASMGGVTRSSALSFGHGGLSATGQQAATTPEVFQRPLSQNPSSFQFGSFNPGSGGGMKHRPTVMKIPKRTSSAPPDFDEPIPQQRRAWGMGGSIERPNLAPDHQRMQASMQEPATSLAAALAEPPPVQQQHQAHHPHQQGILQQSSSQTMKAFNKSTMPLQTHHHAPPPILHTSHSLTGKPPPPGLSGSSQYGHPPPPPSIDQVMQPHPSKATHHLVHLGTEEESWSHTKLKSGLESFHAESGDLQNHPAPALPLARVNPSHKPPPQYRVPGGLLGGVSHQHQTASSSVNRYPSRQAEEHEHVVTHKFSSLDLTKTEVVPGPAESALIPAAVVVSSQLGVDQIHPSNPLPSGIQDSADIENPTPAAIAAAAAPTLEEVLVVHQTGQEEGPPVLGGSCTSDDPEGLVNGQVVGGFDNTLSKSDCKPDPSHQVRVSGEESPPLSSTLENVEDFLVSTTASETTTAVEGDGFEGVGLVDNPVCCAAEQVEMRGNEISKVLEESSIQSNHQQTVEGQEDMQGSSSVMDTTVDGPLLPGSRAHKVADDAGDREEDSARACSTVVVEDPFIEQGPGLQSSAEIATDVESDDGCIPGINSSISRSSLVLGKIDANAEAQSLKVLVARDVSFQAGSQLKDESSYQTQRESLEKADASIDTTMCMEESADDKALKDTTKEEVQRTELPVHNPAVSGGDMNREPPLPSAILGMTHQEHTEDWEVVAELPTPKSALLETLGSEANLDPSQTCREYSRDFLLVYRDRYHDLPGDFAIRQDVAELFSHPLGAGGSSGELSLDTSLFTPGQSLEQQPPSLATPVVDWRVGNSPGPLEEDGHTRAAGILSTSSPSGHGYFGGDMIMAASEFRPPHGHFLPGLIPHLPLRPPPGLSHLTDHWQQRTPSEIRGLIPPPLPLPQHTAAPTIHKAKAPYEVGKVSDMEQIKQRQIKGILNKLTPQNFEKLFAQVKDVNIDSALTLMGVISQIFDKALTEPTFCEMYATFCAELAIVLPEFVEDDEKITFRRVLLNKCQEEFERGEREQEEAEKVEPEGETQLDPKEREEKRSSARRRMLGNIRFIGELYKKSMLTERIMHECIKKLLGEYQHPDEEDVEALCKLMRTIGHIIDHPKARDHIDAYFKRMESLSVNMELPSRIRFMLKDMIDLRRDGWQERRKVEGPKKIDEVHRDAVQERQQAMANTGGRDRFSRGPIIGGLGRGRIVPGSDFGMRGGPPAPLFPPNPRMAAGPAMGFMRGPPLQQGGGARGGPVFGQELHMEESRRFLVDGHSLPTQLSQRSIGEGPITLGPQGGLGRGIVMRGLPPGAVGRSTLADMAPPPMMMMGGDIRRAGGMGIPSGYGGGPNRTPFGARDHHLYGRPPGADRQLGSFERPLLERSVIDRHGPVVSGLRHTGSERTSGNNGSPMVMPMPPAATLQSHRPVTTPFVSVAANPSSVAQNPSDQDLRRKANLTIAEYYRVHDLKEATLCVEELKFPQFYPAMVSMWVSDSLDKRDAERDLLFKLLAHLHNSEPCVLTHDQITKGFESVLSILEDTIVDVPQAPDLLARMLGKLITAGVFSLAQVGKLLRESGPKPPHSLLETGNALIVFGSLLDTLRKQKGEDAMVHMFKDSGLQLEDFCSPVDKHKGATLDRFLEKNNLQCLHPMKPVEKHIGEALGRDEPASEIVQWIQKNVQQPIIAGPEFLRMLMTQVLRRCVPHHDNNLVLKEIKIYAPLLRHFASGKGRAAVENQRQYIVAVQLYANGLDHPQGLMSRLFECFYDEEVISEAAYMKWQDDVHDSTPGRDKAIREVFTWLSWLATAPEEEGDEDD